MEVCAGRVTVVASKNGTEKSGSEGEKFIIVVTDLLSTLFGAPRYVAQALRHAAHDVAQALRHAAHDVAQAL